MATEIVCVKLPDGNLKPATDADKEMLEELSTSYQSYRVTLKSMNPRSYQHHKLFFGGLLPFAFQYYDPSNGFVSKQERAFLEKFCVKLGAATGADKTVLLNAAEEFIQSEAKKRAEKFGGSITKSINAFREWLTIEAGYYDLVHTPRGVKRVARSLSYRSMSSKEDFNAFYRACFGVCWNFILSGNFKSQEEAEKAMNHLMQFG